MQVDRSFFKMSALEEELYQVLAGDICCDFQSGSLLDVGCGNGCLIFYIHRLSQEISITGLDFLPKNIKQAEHYLFKKLRLKDAEEKIRFITGDVLQLPFGDEKFDRVISTCALHHFSDVKASFEEMYRVLKPGGTALIYDFRKEDSYEELKLTMKEWAGKKSRFIRPWVVSRWMQEYWDRYVPKERIEEAVQHSKFKKYRLEPFTIKQRPVLFKLALFRS